MKAAHIVFYLILVVFCVYYGSSTTTTKYTSKIFLFDEENKAFDQTQLISRNSDSVRQSKAEILLDVNKATENMKYLTNSLGPQWFLCPVIKADAYGHGTELYARIAGRIGLTHVCLVDDWEAMVIRDDEHNPARNELSLVRIRAAASEEYSNSLDLGIEETLGNYGNIDKLAELAKKRAISKGHSNVNVHINIDTSMSRNGFFLTPNTSSSVQVEQIVDYLHNSYEKFKLKGFMTHIGLTSIEDVDILINKFLNAVCEISEKIAKKNPKEDFIIHFTNTRVYSIMRLTGKRYTCEMITNNTTPPNLKYMIRAGKAIYGLTNSDSVDDGGDGDLLDFINPVMSLQTSIAAIHYVYAGSLLGYGKVITSRDAIIGTLGIGWADGFPSTLNGNLMNGTTDANVMVFDLKNTWKCKVVVMRPPNMNAMLIDLTFCDYFKNYNKTNILDGVVVEIFGNGGVSALELSRAGNMGSPSYVTTILGKARTLDIDLEYLCSECAVSLDTLKDGCKTNILDGVVVDAESSDHGGIQTFGVWIVVLLIIFVLIAIYLVTLIWAARSRYTKLEVILPPSV